MKQEITKTEFMDSFLQNETYKNNFSYDGLSELYDFLEQLEEDCNMEIEFDMVAICCEYEETCYKDFVGNYSYHFDVFEMLENGEDFDTLREKVKKLCRDNGDFIEINDDDFIYRSF